MVDQEGPNKEECTDHGEVVGRCFLDKLLLAIIDAYPEPSNSAVSAAKRRIERLAEARQALLGQSRPEGRPVVSDEAALRWMASEHYNDLARRDMAKLKGKQPPKIRSDRKLVSDAVSRFKLPENAAERLRRKFRGPAKQKWLDVAVLHDDVPEQLDSNLLESVRGTLARRGIAMKLDQVER